MKFLITRTSSWNSTDDLKLSKRWKITKENYDHIDCRTCKTFEDFEKKFYKKFTDDGINHEKFSGGIRRTFPNQCEGQFIEINTLEELIELYNECGDIIITQNINNGYITEIEIYDDYRE